MSDSGPEDDRGRTEDEGRTEGHPSNDSPGETSPYRADAFQVQRPGGQWHDGSVHTIVGPTLDGITHNIMIHADLDVEAESLYAFAAQGIALLEAELDECRLLINDSIELDCGVPAYRVIVVWYPSDDQRLYQEQLFVLQGGRGYTLTTTFTRETRKQLGETVERMMRSFTPTGAIHDE